MEKYIYTFDEGSKDMKALLGGKGANLAEMTTLGMPVPPGFTITTEACKRFNDEENKLWDSLLDDIQKQVEDVEEKLGKSFGNNENPLLFSVRSGAAESMPGMMDTILNLGLNDVSVEGLAKSTDNKRFAYDSYRRFIQMFADVVMKIPSVHFENELEQAKNNKGVEEDTELNAEDMKQLTQKYLEVYKTEAKDPFPQDPYKQLYLAVEAVFGSWNNNRAILYRQINDINNLLGTAVNVQSMVFGNMGDTSGTGVMFTRNPANGDRELFGEFLMNAQGEDVVAGIRTPLDITELKDMMPDVYEQLSDSSTKLENHYHDMQDIEFTIENGHLYFLQTRTGKRTAASAIQIANDFYNEDIITSEESISKLTTTQLEQLMHPTFEPWELANTEAITQGLAASPGAATGAVYFDAEAVEQAGKQGVQGILVRQETSPEDLAGMVSAQGILTSKGGMTSHAAVVARGMGKCCVAGCSEIKVNETQKKITYQGGTLKEGDIISIDGTTGKVYLGALTQSDATFDDNYLEFMDRVNEIKDLSIRANADTPSDADQALEFGAEGIGLVRTEHMFFKEDRIPVVRRMILANNTDERKVALGDLLIMQQTDFTGIYEAMKERPVTVRLLDPPLHEFLPTNEVEVQKLAGLMNIGLDELKERIEELHEENPMLGHRGVRLAVTYPEISRMQARAVIQAAIEVKKDKGYEVKPEIMIPLVGDVKEFVLIKDHIEEEIQEVLSEAQMDIDYSIGTMIEIPRATLLAEEIAKEADFFSFGTNDLTQMTFGFSRDDAGSFIHEYLDKGLLEADPFQTLDQHGVGQLVKLAVEKARKVKPDIKLGVCGEHGGDPKSIQFFNELGLDYVSCSPFRVPIARLAAAQSELQEKRNQPALASTQQLQG